MSIVFGLRTKCWALLCFSERITWYTNCMISCIRVLHARSMTWEIRSACHESHLNDPFYKDWDRHMLSTKHAWNGSVECFHDVVQNLRKIYKIPHAPSFKIPACLLSLYLWERCWDSHIAQRLRCYGGSCSQWHYLPRPLRWGNISKGRESRQLGLHVRRIGDAPPWII